MPRGGRKQPLPQISAGEEEDPEETHESAGHIRIDAAAAEDPEERRTSLEGIIAESDQLIRTFNALLMISRVEAGAVAAEMAGLSETGATPGEKQTMATVSEAAV